MTRASGDVNIERMPERQPRTVHIYHFDVVAHHCCRRVDAGIVGGIQRHRARVLAHPGSRLDGHRAVRKHEHRVFLHDITPIGASARERRVGKVMHVVGEENFVKPAIGTREQNWRTAHTQSLGTASNPVRGIARRQQEFRRWRTA